MDQYCFLLTGSDWSQTDMRFQDENSRCLLWRRMSSNRAVRPLMKPTGRQRHRNQSLHSPTHLTWLERLNWRAWDCGCSSSCRCCCLGSLLHCSPPVLKWFSIGVFFFFQLCVSCRMTCPDQYYGEDLFHWLCVNKMSKNVLMDFRRLFQYQLNVCVPRIFMFLKLQHSVDPGHSDISDLTNPNVFFSRRQLFFVFWFFLLFLFSFSHPWIMDYSQSKWYTSPCPFLLSQQSEKSPFSVLPIDWFNVAPCYHSIQHW